MTEKELKMWKDDLAMIEMLRKEKEELQNRIQVAIRCIQYLNYVEFSPEELIEILNGYYHKLGGKHAR